MKTVLSFLLLLCMSTIVNADKSVRKTVFINQANYADKSTPEIKKILLDKAKIDAASEIFGDFIKSETDIENGKMIRNLIVSEKNGLVHLEGLPLYSNGRNLGDMQVTITAYATEQDLRDMSIQTVYLDDFVYTNKNIALKNLKKSAEDAFLVAAITSKKPALKNNPNQVKIARSIATSLNITEMTYDVETASYLMNGSVEYIPFFLKNK